MQRHHERKLEPRALPRCVIRIDRVWNSHSSSLFVLAGWRPKARGWLEKTRRFLAATPYAVKISLRFCVKRKRYSRPSWSMINSPRSPNNWRLVTRSGRRTGGAETAVG